MTTPKNFQVFSIAKHGHLFKYKQESNTNTKNQKLISTYEHLQTLKTLKLKKLYCENQFFILNWAIYMQESKLAKKLFN